MRSIAAAFLALFAVTHSGRHAALRIPTVTLPLDQYQLLQKSKESVLRDGHRHDDPRRHVQGPQSSRSRFAGRSVGARTANERQSATPATSRFSGCSGDALMLRSGKGAYELVALAPSLSRCVATFA